MPYNSNFRELRYSALFYTIQSTECLTAFSPPLIYNHDYPFSHNMKLLPMAKTLFTSSTLFTLASLSVIPVSYAEPVKPAAVKQEIVIVDGREVILNSDGTWKYLSTDRYVNTKDGTRVRLKDDGSWQYMGNVPLTSKEQVRTTDLDIKLQKVVIETYKKKSQKNTSVKTQTVFYVHLAYSPQAKRNISINKSDISLIEVKDNNGKNYPVLSIKPGSKQLQANTSTTIVVRAEKSPSIWDNVKSMEIVFNTGFLEIETPVTLSQNTIDFDKENVDGFDY